MSIIQDSLKPEVQQFLAGSEKEVTVDFYPYPESPASQPMQELFEELAALAPFIKPVVHQDRAKPQGVEQPEDVEGPVATLSVDGAFTGIRFLGFPGGREFSTLLADLRDLSQGQPTELSPETQNWLRDLTSPLHLEVFTTPT
ncbi:hypothetical protein [Sulfobacillus harzensis]|uniref:Uncharacterized protein n=1 Tax=Sulfobacillus harzensis TaxID=2729629 RepID=A0A7Y0Q1C1_9FIRM|nr:hypothetical protein [Sulfobacillus harzensis]NMP21185.1 hypothetical protein [Sulfobacillus harzensis]